MDKDRLVLINLLASKVINDFGKSNHDIEKNCWIIVHEYHHGVKPTEYDVREVEEELYLAVLSKVKAEK